jgi:hypothetical protein
VIRLLDLIGEVSDVVDRLIPFGERGGEVVLDGGEIRIDLLAVVTAQHDVEPLEVRWRPCGLPPNLDPRLLAHGPILPNSWGC